MNGMTGSMETNAYEHKGWNESPALKLLYMKIKFFPVGTPYLHFYFFFLLYMQIKLL